MQPNTDETIRKLLASIVEDFWKQLDGPFHRGGASGLSFSAIRSPIENEVCGFQIVTGGSEWQERLSTIRVLDEIGVIESTVVCEDCQNPEKQKMYHTWMSAETLEGLHRIAKEFVQHVETLRDRAGRVNGESELYGQFLETALSYYYRNAEMIDFQGER